MRTTVLLVFFCLFVGDALAQNEEFEEEEFMKALCAPKNIQNVAQCGQLLPRPGLDVVFKCGHDVTGAYSDNMVQAAETFCYREDIRDTLFLCWERGLSNIHDSLRNDEERRRMDNFENCIRTVMDQLYDA